MNDLYDLLFRIWIYGLFVAVLLGVGYVFEVEALQQAGGLWIMSPLLLALTALFHGCS